MQPPTNKNSGTRSRRLLSTLFALVILIGLLGAAVTHERAILDWWKLRGYRAPAAIDQLATQDTLTEQARHIFYVNHPLTEDRTNFLNDCPSGTKEQTIVLGCYKSDQAGIYVLNVTDSRLDGVKQVTAAHEMLHAAYDRLSSLEKQTIDAQLLDYYHTGLQDERIKTTIDAYKQSEPKDVVNEMHSIFGTEVAKLPKNLENYYQRYFTNRASVVGYSARYETEFTSRKDQIASDDAFLKLLKSQISTKDADLKSRQAEIATRQASLADLRNSNNVDAYNAAVPNYNQLVTAYNAEVQAVRSLIDQYNVVVSRRNAIAVEEDQLVQSLTAQNQPINN